MQVPKPLFDKEEVEHFRHRPYRIRYMKKLIADSADALEKKNKVSEDPDYRLLMILNVIQIYGEDLAQIHEHYAQTLVMMNLMDAAIETLPRTEEFAAIRKMFAAQKRAHRRLRQQVRETKKLVREHMPIVRFQGDKLESMWKKDIETEDPLK